MKYYINKESYGIVVFNNFVLESLEDKYIEITKEQYDEYQEKKNGYERTVEIKAGKAIMTYVKKENKNKLRGQREAVLTAFDKYKTNVLYGIETETEEQKKEVIEYYNKLLVLDEDAINNVPSYLKYYMYVIDMQRELITKKPIKNGIYVCVDEVNQIYKFIDAKDVVLSVNADGSKYTLGDFKKDFDVLKDNFIQLASIVKEVNNND